VIVSTLQLLKFAALLTQHLLELDDLLSRLLSKLLSPLLKFLLLALNELLELLLEALLILPLLRLQLLELLAQLGDHLILPTLQDRGFCI
jgi:hypothetical protein